MSCWVSARHNTADERSRTDLIKAHVLDLSLVRRELQRVVETGQSAVDMALRTEENAE